jgi:hypothetical protein
MILNLHSSNNLYLFWFFLLDKKFFLFY